MNNAAIRESIRGLRSNPARTVLTTLGIVIGIATVILVLSAGAGFRSLIDSEVGALGANTLFIKTRVPPTTKSRASQAVQPGLSGGGSFSGVVISSLKQRDLDDIARLANVTGDYGMVTGQAVASYRGSEKSVIYYGASAGRFAIDTHKLSTGRFYSPAEDAGGAQVAILGSAVAKDLFGQDNPIGKLMRLGTLNFEVIGVYESQGLSFGADDGLYIPLATAQKKMLGIDYLSVAVVQLRDQTQAPAVTEQIAGLLRHNHRITDPNKDDFQVQSQAQALDTFNVIFGGITALLIAIAAISLVVGGVGIMNIMYVVVTERTSEIGLKKALGATNRDILSEFLLESVFVTVLGGVIGIILGALLGWIVSLIANANQLAWAFSVPPSAIALAFGVSAAIGIGFGVWPARNASRLDPIEALRYE